MPILSEQRSLCEVIGFALVVLGVVPLTPSEKPNRLQPSAHGAAAIECAV